MMRGLVAFFPCLVFALAHCASGDAGPPAEGGDEPAPKSAHVASCHATCTTAADCGSAGTPLQDSAHYACEAGRCTWTGCTSDSECASAAQGKKAVCRKTQGSTVAKCMPACQAAADCAIPNGAVQLADASHFTCDDGACAWKGCTSASECSAALRTKKVACEQPDGALTRTCVPTCTTAADCAIPGVPLNDKGHFACEAGRCAWLGCRSTAECRSALQSAKVICD